MDLIIRVTRVTNYVGRCVSSCTKRPNATSKRYLKTQALMGATRLASGIVQQLFSWGVPFLFISPTRLASGKYAVMPYNYQCSLSKTLQMLSASSPTM